MSLFRNLIDQLDNNKIKEINKNIYDLNKNNDNYWNFLLENTNIDSALILENLNNINLKNLLKKKALPKIIINNEEFQKTIKNNNLENYLIKYQTIPLSYLTKIVEYKLSENNVNNDNEQNLNWNYICQYQDLTIEFMNKYKSYLNWNLISEFQLLSISFIANNIDNIKWELIGDNLKTRYLYNDAFMQLFSDKPIWDCVIWSNKISNDFLIENINKLSYEQLNDLFKYKNLDQDTLINIINTIKIQMNEELINSIIEGQTNLNDSFIYENINSINFDNLVSNQKLDLKFIFKYKKHISLKHLAFNDDFDEDMLMNIYPYKNEYKEDFDWDFISKYINLSKETINSIKEIDKELVIMNDLLE